MLQSRWPPPPPPPRDPREVNTVPHANDSEAPHHVAQCHREFDLTSHACPLVIVQFPLRVKTSSELRQRSRKKQNWSPVESIELLTTHMKFFTEECIFRFPTSCSSKPSVLPKFFVSLDTVETLS